MLTRGGLLADFVVVSFFPLAKGESQTMDQRVSVATLGVKDLGEFEEILRRRLRLEAGT